MCRVNASRPVALRKLQNIFELAFLAFACPCVCGVHFEQVLDLAALSEGLATLFPIHRAVPDA